MFKVGQKVWAIGKGWGKIISVDDFEPNDPYSISVQFENCGEDYFTLDGRYRSGEGYGRELFFKEIKIPNDALLPPVEHLILYAGDIVLLNSGDLGYVESFSDYDSDEFSWHSKVPNNLDDAYYAARNYKNIIKKVIGNINE